MKYILVVAFAIAAIDARKLEIKENILLVIEHIR